MTQHRLATPMFGAVARTDRGRTLLTPPALRAWVARWVGGEDADAWWIDDDRQVAMLRPEVAARAATPAEWAVLSIRGAVAQGGRRDPPPGWPELGEGRGAGIVLNDLIARDTAALRDLRGRFALACWDGRRRRLILARDHFGQRGLFVRTEPDVLLFCSELGPLLRPPSGGCALDVESAFWHLAFGCAAPGRTLARHVGRVPAAHALILERDAPPVMTRYWSPLDVDAPSEITDDVVSALRDAISRAVAREADGMSTTGALLSGGVDSTFLCATAAMAGAAPRTAFTSAFEPEHRSNEEPFAAAVAQWLGMEHHVVPLLAGDAYEILDNVVLSSAEPCAAWAAMTHFRILATASQHGVRRLFSGLGADELFGGYDHFRGAYARLVRRAARRPPPPGVSVLESLLGLESQDARRSLFPGVARFFDDPSLRAGLEAPYSGWHYAPHLRAFYRECLQIKPEAAPIELMVAHEIAQRIPDVLFPSFEPMARRMGIEMVYPFLDPDVARLAAGLNMTSRYRTKHGKFSLHLRRLQPRFKYAMMRVAEDRVPREIRERSRQSLTAPFGGWLFEPAFGAHVLHRVRSSRFWETGIVRRAWLDHLIAIAVPGPSPAAFQLWAITTISAWYDRYVDSPGP